MRGKFLDALLAEQICAILEFKNQFLVWVLDGRQAEVEFRNLVIKFIAAEPDAPVRSSFLLEGECREHGVKQRVPAQIARRTNYVHQVLELAILVFKGAQARPAYLFQIVNKLQLAFGPAPQ